MPVSVAEEIAVNELTLDLFDSPEAPLDAAHFFVTERAKLERELCRLLPLLAKGGFIWVSWPKRRPRSRPTSPRTPSAKSAFRWAWST